MDDEELVKVFSKECEKGDLEEVKKMLDSHDIQSLFPSMNRSDCPLCVSIVNKQNHILLELLDRGFKIEGSCSYKKGYDCTTLRVIHSENKEAAIILILRGLDITLFDDGATEYELVSNLLLDIIKDGYTESFVKPASRY